MSATKASVEFLDGSDSAIIKKCMHIIKAMTKNPVFKFTPVSPEGIQSAVDHFDAMYKKAKKGGKENSESLSEARGDVDNYIRQTADFINNKSLLPEELETTGFDLIKSAPKQPKAEAVLSS